MTTRTITTRRSYNKTVAGATFVDGVATVDDTTAAGKAAIEFAKRHGWAVSGVAAAEAFSFATGAPIADMTVEELKGYLTAWNVEFPDAASETDLRNAMWTAYETRAQGGSASYPTAGHTQGTFPVLDAPNVPGDDDPKTELWNPPVTPSASDLLPSFTNEPDNATAVEGETATFSSTLTGSPLPTRQWQRQAKGVGEFVDIVGATTASYTTPALTVADNNGDKYRVVATNDDGSTTSAVAMLTVTAAA